MTPLCLVLVIAAASSLPVTAQVRGTVTDDHGTPLPDVLVELWSPTRRLAGTLTDRAGGYVFLVAPADSLVVLARRPGYRPMRAHAGVQVLDLTLRPRPIPLSPIPRMVADSCHSRDDPAARALWHAMATRYDANLSAEGLQAELLRFRAVVPPESLGAVDTNRLEPARLAVRGRRSPGPHFYVYPAIDFIQGRHDRWAYAWLESAQAWHFVDPGFAQLNSLVLTDSDSAGAVISFCSRRSGPGYVQGQLFLAPDTTLARVTWRFVAPAEPEDAGGEVYFAAPASGPAPPLLPVSGLYFRRLARGYYTEWVEFREWRRCFGPRCDATAPLR